MAELEPFPAGNSKKASAGVEDLTASAFLSDFVDDGLFGKYVGGNKRDSKFVRRYLTQTVDKRPNVSWFFDKVYCTNRLLKKLINWLRVSPDRQICLEAASELDFQPLPGIG